MKNTIVLNIILDFHQAPEIRVVQEIQWGPTKRKNLMQLCNSVWVCYLQYLPYLLDGLEHLAALHLPKLKWSTQCTILNILKNYSQVHRGDLFDLFHQIFLLFPDKNVFLIKKNI